MGNPPKSISRMDLPKQKRYAYEKAFSLKGVLQNLKTYQLARGEIEPSEIQRARHDQGDDVCRVFGSLVSGQTSSTSAHQSRNTRRRRRRRGRSGEAGRSKKQKLEAEEHEQNHPTSHTHQNTLNAAHLNSPLDQSHSQCSVIEATPLKLSLSSTSVSSSPSLSPEPSAASGVQRAKVIGSLGLLAADYSDSSSEGESGGGCEGGGEGEEGRGEGRRGEDYGDGGSADQEEEEEEEEEGEEEGEEEEEEEEEEEKGRKEEDEVLTPTERSERFDIPDVIKAMFEEEEGKGERVSEAEERSEVIGGLGFFEAPDTDEEDEDGGRRQVVEVQVPGASREPEARWDGRKRKWIFPPSELTTYVCSKCNKVGHLTQDCTVRTDNKGEGHKVSPRLKSLYARGREVANRRGVQCADCGVPNNLVCCLDCRSVYCDGRGHLSSHLHQHPSHQTLYSFKLRKLIKCSKATCEVVSVYDLLICSHCLSKAFSQHYSMVTASWSGSGLKKIQNAICCEDHFQWHRINCSVAYEEQFITREKLDDNLISEFFF